MRKILWIATIIAGLMLYGVAHPWIQQQELLAATALRLSAQQIALQHYADTSAYIHRELAVLLSAIHPARIRVAFVRPPAQTDTLAITLKFDVLYAVTSPNHLPGEMTMNAPVTEWGDYFHALIQNRCVWMDIKEVTSEDAVKRMKELRMVKFLACPIWNQKNQMLGGIFLSWDEGDVVPSDADIRNIEKTVRDSANRIGQQTAYGV